MNFRSFKVHHATPDSILVQMPEGGFGRLTAESLGNDKLAERMLQWFAARATIYASPRRFRDAQGYLTLGIGLDEVWSGVLCYPQDVCRSLCGLFRRHQVVGLGSVQTAKLARSSSKGSIFSLSNGLTAVAPLETTAGAGSTDGYSEIRVLALDASTGGVAASCTESLVSQAPADDDAVVEAARRIPAGTSVDCRVLLAQDDLKHTVVELTLESRAEAISLIGYVLSPEGSDASSNGKQLPRHKRGERIRATVEFAPASADLAHLCPFVVLSEREPFCSIPPVRLLEPSAGSGLKGPFPWRDAAALERQRRLAASAAHNAEDVEKPLRRRRIEEAIDAFERDDQSLPKSPDEFQKLLLASPNSSFLWTQYMAFHVGLQQYEEGRLVAEKALKTVGVRETKELQNIWVAYMNLENTHGTAESLTQVFRRALRHTDDELIIHEKLADIFESTRKWQQLLALCRVMTSKFRNTPRVWERLGVCLIQQDKRDQLKRMIKDMAGAIKQHDQCLVLEHLAIHEYRQGHVPSGRALFEGLVTRAPKHSDVWSAFLDQELALLVRKENEGSVTVVRDLFERVTSLPFSTRVMQMLLSRYLAFEQQHGTPHGVDKVKEKARNYVESRIASTVSGPATS